MKLKFNLKGKTQPDPFVFEDGNDFYLYVTASEGVEVYRSNDLFGEWTYEGIAASFENGKNYWAPSVIKIDDTYYMYVSFENEKFFQYMHVASSDSPLGPFGNEKCLYNYFSIDSHMVKTNQGLFLWYAADNVECELKGTRIFVDKFIDPYTPENNPKEVIVPTFEEEKFTPHCTEEQNWYTIEGPFWFKEGEWQYVMYSAGCYEDDTYHIGYAVAKSDDGNLKNIDFVKVTNGTEFNPVIIKNEVEEGTGHHSVIKYYGKYYAIYHARDYWENVSSEYQEQRTARICKLDVNNGKITSVLCRK